MVTNLMRHRAQTKMVEISHPALAKALGIVRAPTPIIKLNT